MSFQYFFCYFTDVFFPVYTQELFLKETVHPKMKILSSFTPNLYECVCSEHKEWGKQQYFFSYYGSQWCPKTAWLQTFFKISSFVFRTNTFIQVWIYLRRVNDDRIFIFGCTVPLRAVSCLVAVHEFTQADLALEALQIKLDVLVHLPLLVRQMCDCFSNAGDQDLPAGADEFIWGSKLVLFIETSGTVKSRTV